MEFVQVIVPAVGVVLLTLGSVLARWQGAQARRAVTLERMNRYGEPLLRTPPHLAAL